MDKSQSIKNDHRVKRDIKKEESEVDIAQFIPVDTAHTDVSHEVYKDDGTDKAFVDYDPALDTRPYHVYRNDIKFRTHKKVDPTRAIWDDDVKKDFMNKQTDSIDYRLEECQRENFETLDLSHMNNDCFTFLFQHKYFKNIVKKVQHIFAQDCQLRVVPDLSEFESLVTLDISSNKLTELPVLPESLEELIINNNRLTKVDNSLPNLKRFSANNNKIQSINYGRLIEIIYLKNNPIDHIPALDNLYRLDISTTKIKKLHSYPKLKFLNCSFTSIVSIPTMDVLEHLICNDSNVSDISLLKTLQSLEIVNTKVICVHYMKDLYSIVYDGDAKLALSKKYRLKHVKKNKSNICEITFDTSEQVKNEEHGK